MTRKRARRRGLGYSGAGVLAAVVVVIVGWLWLSRSQDQTGSEAGAFGDPPPATVLDVIPDGAMLVATVDLDQLRRSPTGSRLIGQGRQIAGLGQVQEICGSDPMAAVTELALAIPAAGLDTDLGIFAAGPIEAAALLGCAETIISRRGGKPVRVPRGTFQVLRDASLAVSGAQLAARDGGPVLLAEGDYLERSLAVAQGSGRSVRHSPQHQRLRQQVGSGAVVASIVLTAEQRAKLIAELAAQQMKSSPFGAITAGALRLRLEATLDVYGVLTCDRPGACAEVAQLLDQARQERAAELQARLVGLAMLLEAITVRSEGDEVHLGLHLPVEQALQLVRQLLALRQLEDRPERPPPETPPPSPTDSADAGAAAASDAGRGSAGTAAPAASAAAQTPPRPGGAGAEPTPPPAPPRAP